MSVQLQVSPDRVKENLPLSRDSGGRSQLSDCFMLEDIRPERHIYSDFQEMASVGSSKGLGGYSPGSLTMRPTGENIHSCSS